MLFFKARLALEAALRGGIRSQAIDTDLAAAVSAGTTAAVAYTPQRRIDFAQCIRMTEQFGVFAIRP